MRDVAASLEHLFRVVHAEATPLRGWRNSEVVARCRAAGFRLSESHLSELRRGVKVNPTVATVRALAWFFEVPVSYFSDPQRAELIDVELAARREAALERERDRVDAEHDAAAAAAELDAALRDYLREVRARPYRSFRRGSDHRQRTDDMRSLTTALTSRPRPTAARDWRTRAEQMRALTDQLRSA